ncbi:hypothetical protein LEMA_P058700.1 [Plenodomus lingam JN3]|uniref:RING-type E3 ubiquitin transferase n=1 Tax=Leptosphaeria maculans (strain JN3 / isolate v23.1.3 / race Av1-4-5-6-7-8) TaxID=985895 RepID=E4ZHK3_LEPMJ|nr:hypothetical protein LEMA_P058700.1 [Plenodomus lingam JN3]CBX90836.1 hypothetical protein LEMA_P058700.1 [Plenodomus lingam JN3]
MGHPHDQRQSPGLEDIDSNQACCICYNAYNAPGSGRGREQSVQLACGHRFGTKCISKWIKAKSTCPLCRAPQVRFGDHCYSKVLREHIRLDVATPHVERTEPDRTFATIYWWEMSDERQSSPNIAPQSHPGRTCIARPVQNRRFVGRVSPPGIKYSPHFAFGIEEV